MNSKRRSVWVVALIALLSIAGLGLHRWGLNYRLWDAARVGNLTATQLLLHQGANPDSSWQGLPALEAAAWAGYTNIAEVLLNSGAAPGKALNKAAAQGRVETLQLLLVKTHPDAARLHAALLAAKTNQQNEPSRYAKVIALLLQAGAKG